ncbi:hypothetical protein SAMN05444672_10459 [Bacillus sp. OK838]|nr:hypothetical protein SAMN05444672_10459 [Bacillus sp. OK838]
MEVTTRIVVIRFPLNPALVTVVNVVEAAALEAASP